MEGMRTHKKAIQDVEVMEVMESIQKPGIALSELMAYFWSPNDRLYYSDG